GFTGSAGFAIATRERCAIFVDGRYTLQVREQVDPDAFTPESLMENPPSKWLSENTTKDDVIGFDPWLITAKQIKAYEEASAKTGAELKSVDNLIDRIWQDQPAPPLGKVFVHPVAKAGVEVDQKIEDIKSTISNLNCDLAILTDPASLAWLFNIRGQDVVHNPVPLGFAIVLAAGNPILFIDERKLDDPTKKYLQSYATLLGPEQLIPELKRLCPEKSVLCDLGQLPVMLHDAVTAAKGSIVDGRDPVILPRSIKNRVELEGTRTAHIRDGVAMCKFLYWLNQQKPETVTEISAAKMLEQIRTENAKTMGSELREIAFDTISGHGPNGAIVHYRVTEESNRTFTDDSLFLCDSGGQYPDGTTDITRTVAIGTPPEKAIEDFTLVLKGHIAIATARFPEGTRGVDIDVLARIALWEHGKDFAHGTGHGVGSYLNVHEGPQSISKRGMEGFKAGMIISNEPGFYIEGEYGIRIENLVVVSEAEENLDGNIKTHTFETITLAPIDTRLVRGSNLSEKERDWLNAYHKTVCDTLGEYLNKPEKAWLEKVTKPI
ncbi:MAG: aminopeptidase P family protein, partial [Pseudomonadota bacterium]